MRTLCVCYDLLIKGLAAAAALSIGAMALWVTYDVVFRYLLVQPTIWSTDLAGYTLIASTFLAAPWVLRRNAHVSVDMLTNVLPVKPRRVLAIVVAFVGALICGIFAWETGLTVHEFYVRERTLVRAWSLPLYIPYLAIPIGSALLTVEFLRQAIRLIASDKELRASMTSRDTGL